MKMMKVGRSHKVGHGVMAWPERHDGMVIDVPVVRCCDPVSPKVKRVGADAELAQDGRDR